MAINFNNSSNSVKHIYLKSKNQYVQELVLGSSVRWEEYVGVYQSGSLPAGVASLNCSRTSQDPAVPVGAISPGASLYNKDVLTFTATPTAYHTVSVATSTYTVAARDPNNTETRTYSFDGVTISGVAGAPELVNITLKPGTGIASFGYTYWAGDDSATQKEGTYSGGLGALLSAWRGHSVKWFDIAAASGYALLNSTYASGSLEAGFESQIVTVGKAYPYEWRDVLYDDDFTLPATVSNNTNFLYAWKLGGLGKYEKVRVSGTATITAKATVNGTTYSNSTTISFTDVELASGDDSTFTSLGEYLVSKRVGASTTTSGISIGTLYSATGKLMMRKDNNLYCYVSNDATLRRLGVSDLSVTLSSVQVYIPFGVSDAFRGIIDTDSTGRAFVIASNFYPYDIYALGRMSWEHNDSFVSDSFELIMGDITDNSEQELGMTSFVDTGDDGAYLVGGDLYFALMSPTGTYMVTPMYCVSV